MIDESQLFEHLRNLNIPQDADFSISDIHSAYKLMARFYHPDTKKINSSDEKMKSINISYDFLKNHFDEIKEMKLFNANHQASDEEFTEYYVPKNTHRFKKLPKIILWLISGSFIVFIIVSFIVALINGNA
jgi:hypothetical protein